MRPPQFKRHLERRARVLTLIIQSLEGKWLIEASSTSCSATVKMRCQLITIGTFSNACQLQFGISICYRMKLRHACPEFVSEAGWMQRSHPQVTTKSDCSLPLNNPWFNCPTVTNYQNDWSHYGSTRMNQEADEILLFKLTVLWNKEKINHIYLNCLKMILWSVWFSRKKCTLGTVAIPFKIIISKQHLGFKIYKVQCVIFSNLPSKMICFYQNTYFTCAL